MRSLQRDGDPLRRVSVRKIDDAHAIQGLIGCADRLHDNLSLVHIEAIRPLIGDAALCIRTEVHEPGRRSRRGVCGGGGPGGFFARTRGDLALGFPDRPRPRA